MTPILTRRAPLAPASSLDIAARTLEVTFASETPVARMDWNGPFDEVLALDGMRTEALPGAPVLDGHRTGSVRDVIGTIESVRIEAGAAIAALRFSARAELDPILADIQAGILRDVSVGYRVGKWQESRDKAGRLTKRAVDWQPIEISLVPIGADPTAKVRSMPDDLITESPPASELEIRGIAQQAGLDAEFIRQQLGTPAVLDQVRAAALKLLAERDEKTATRHAPRVTGGIDHSAPEAVAARMGEALFARANPAHQLSEGAWQYAHLTVPQIAAEVLRLRGQSVAGLSPDSLIQRAGALSTGDLPLIFGDVTGRTLREAYTAAPSEIARLCRQAAAPDFRARHRLWVDGSMDFQAVGEGGEIRSAFNVIEGGEAYKIDTFATRFGITRQAMVNDDLGAITRQSQQIGTQAAGWLAQYLVGILTGPAGVGPNLADGPVFATTRGNLTDLSAIDEASVAAARLHLRRVKSPAGTTLGLRPKYLLIPPERETEAEKFLASIAATKTADVNPFSGALELIVESRLPDPQRWYVIADPAQIDGIEFAFLSGQAGPQVETKADFDSFALHTRVWFDVGAGWLDWRGWYQNQGS